jgi:hypothetical protein
VEGVVAAQVQEARVPADLVALALCDDRAQVVVDAFGGDALKPSGIRISRAVHERCGNLIEALFTAAGAEPELADPSPKASVATEKERASPSAESKSSAGSEEACRRSTPRHSSRSAPTTKPGAS